MKETVIHSALLNESYRLYTHPSGLQIALYPMKDFSSVYAIFGTRYGSMDNMLTADDGTVFEVPTGIAHFLEHKMFEKEDGDVFEKFSAYGSNANAYTSFECTAYLFSTTQNTEDSLKTLLEFVQQPYFTEASVQKELGIIDQEIRMYEDDPNWRVFFNMLNNLYHNNPVKIDVAGTSDSIAQITPELLYQCYNTYYNPANMILAIAGNFDEEAILSIINETLRDDIVPSVPQKPVIDEPKEIVRAYSEQKLAVSSPVFHIGFKEDPVDEETELNLQMKFTLLSELIAGKSSELYQSLYEAQTINTSFGKDVFIGRGFAMNYFTGEAEDVNAIADALCSTVEAMRANGISQADFERIRRSVYGQSVMMFGEVDHTANTLFSAHLSGRSLFDALDIIKEITKEELEELLNRSYRREYMTISVILPSDK